MSCTFYLEEVDRIRFKLGKFLVTFPDDVNNPADLREFKATSLLLFSLPSFLASAVLGLLCRLSRRYFLSDQGKK